MLWSRRAKRGFSIIEIMVALAIIGLMFFVVVPGVNRIFQADLRSTARKLMSLSQGVYNEAVLNKRLFRIVVDLDENVVRIEVSLGGSAVMLADWGDEFDEEDAAGYQAFEEGFSEFTTPGFRGFKLPTGVVILDVVNTAIYPDAVTDGLAYIYFYPHGEMDPALIHVSEERPRGVSYTVEYMPITGSSRLYAGYVWYGGEEVEFERWER